MYSQTIQEGKYCKILREIFILAYTKYYLIYNLDVYHGKKETFLFAHSCIRGFPITHKAVTNTILRSGIDNYEHGSRNIFMDNIYGSTIFSSTMAYSLNIHTVGTFKYDRKGFDSEALNLDNNCECGTFIIQYDRRLGMVITRWKDSIIIQTVSKVISKGAGIESCMKGDETV